MLKMSPSDVNDDPLLADEGKEVPRFLFVSRDYSTVKVVEGSKMKTKNVYNMMKKFASKEYKTKFDKHVKATLKLLIEFDKINGAMKTLKAKEARLGSDITKAEEKKIAKEKEELETRQKEADEKKKELLTFVLKEKKKA